MPSLFIFIALSTILTAIVLFLVLKSVRKKLRESLLMSDNNDRAIIKRSKAKALFQKRSKEAKKNKSYNFTESNRKSQLNSTKIISHLGGLIFFRQ